MSNKLYMGKKHRLTDEPSDLEIEPHSRKPKIATLSISSSKEVHIWKFPKVLKMLNL